MSNLLDIFFIGPTGLIANSATAFYQWISSCIGGACGTTPASVTEILTGFGSNLSSTINFLGSSASKLFLGLFSFLPSGGAFPGIFHSSAVYFGNMLASIAFFFPVTALIYCMSLILSIKFALWAFHLLRVAISFARGVSVDTYR